MQSERSSLFQKPSLTYRVIKSMKCTQLENESGAEMTIFNILMIKSFQIVCNLSFTWIKILISQK